MKHPHDRRLDREGALVESEVIPDAHTTFRMPVGSGLRRLTLRVRDLDAVQSFYAERVGMPLQRLNVDSIELTPAGGAFTLELIASPQAPQRPHPSVGLYHFALLLPGRAALAAVIRRLLEAKWPLDGASDHGVSEAFYLRDPEGNGIELYCDRPRESWPVRSGGVEMVTKPLDVTGLLAEAKSPGPLDPATVFGHIHLHVADLGEGERFYAGGLGLDVTQRSYPGALFLSVGGYHHHVGLNTWAQGRRAAEGATGLTRYAWAVPAGALPRLGGHLRARNVPFEEVEAGIALSDPAGVRIEIRET
ncbi:MAG TPA: VOC family protein [bacterium]|nr:VOC family protein [bacterium]